MIQADENYEEDQKLGEARMLLFTGVAIRLNAGEKKKIRQSSPL